MRRVFLKACVVLSKPQFIFSISFFSLAHTHSRPLILTVSQKDSDSCFAADRLLIRQLNVCSGLAPVFLLNTLRALSTHTHTYRSSRSPQSLMYVESQLSNYSLCHNILFVQLTSLFNTVKAWCTLNDQLLYCIMREKNAKHTDLHKHEKSITGFLVHFFLCTHNYQCFLHCYSAPLLNQLMK